MPSLSRLRVAVRRLPRLALVGTTVLGSTVALAAIAPSVGAQGNARFEVRFPASLSATPITGRVFIALSPRNDVEPRIAAYQSARTRVGRIPFFAADVEQLAPGATATIGADAIGYPYWAIKDLPAGEYYVQAVFNVYTKFARADGHTIWAHQDQWEGQRWAFSPGNLVSTPVKVRIDPTRGFRVPLTFDHVIPPIEVEPDTKWVKRIKFQSAMLTKWWGHPQYLGATVLLPKGYDENPDVRYPVVFVQDHFTLAAPFNFTTADTPSTPGLNLAAPGTWTAADIGRPSGGAGQRESGFRFYQQWIRDDMPRMIVVKFQHPTPFFDDSYAVNSANNGPYGDAILQELIPELEKRFRMIGKPYARVLTGGSTGGWEALALQVYHPDFFGGTWPMYPDPVDFRRYQLIDIYRDTSAFLVPNAAPGAPERMMQMSPEGQPVATMRQISQMELASGTRGRSAAQIDVWNATYGPVGADGYPRQLWDLKTGVIDREVATYMRDHGYDLRHYLETNWARIGPSLVGKLHVLTGDMDDFYLAPAIYLLENFLESTRAPYYGGSFRYGRPMKGHGWQPMTNADLLREMADHIARRAPAGEPVRSWREGR